MSAGNGGLFSSARRLLGTVLELAQVRLELVAAEIEIEKLRLFDALLLALAALLGLGVGVVLLCAFIIVLAGEAHRLLALGVLSLLFVGGSVWALQSARKRLRSPGTLFDSSAAELARDRAELMPGDG